MRGLAHKRRVVLAEADEAINFCECRHSERMHKVYYGDECIAPMCDCDSFRMPNPPRLMGRSGRRASNQSRAK